MADENKGDKPEFSALSGDELRAWKEKAPAEELESYRQWLSKDSEGLEQKKASLLADVSKARQERREVRTLNEEAKPKEGEKKDDDPLKELKDKNQNLLFSWAYDEYPELNPSKDEGDGSFNEVKRFLPRDFSIVDLESAKKDFARAYGAAFPEQAAEIAHKRGEKDAARRKLDEQNANAGGMGGGGSDKTTKDEDKPTAEDEAQAKRLGVTVESYMQGKKLGNRWTV